MCYQICIERVAAPAQVARTPVSARGDPSGAPPDSAPLFIAY